MTFCKGVFFDTRQFNKSDSQQLDCAYDPKAQRAAIVSECLKELHLNRSEVDQSNDEQKIKVANDFLRRPKSVTKHYATCCHCYYENIVTDRNKYSVKCRNCGTIIYCKTKFEMKYVRCTTCEHETRIVDDYVFKCTCCHAINETLAKDVHDTPKQPIRLSKNRIVEYEHIDIISDETASVILDLQHQIAQLKFELERVTAERDFDREWIMQLLGYNY